MAYNVNDEYLANLFNQRDYSGLLDQYLNMRGGAANSYSPFYRSTIQNQADRLGGIFDVMEAFKPQWDQGNPTSNLGANRFQDMFRSMVNNVGPNQNTFAMQKQALNALKGGNAADVTSFETAMTPQGGDATSGQNAIANVIKQLGYGYMSPIQMAMKFGGGNLSSLEDRFNRQVAPANPDARFTTWLLSQLGM